MEREREARHGTRSAYVGGCHCAPCTAANARYERRRARRARGIGVSTTVLGAVSAGVEATLGTVSESDEHAALRALASALALELDSILASADHSPTHTASISAQLRATLAELSIGTSTASSRRSSPASRPRSRRSEERLYQTDVAVLSAS